MKYELVSKETLFKGFFKVDRFKFNYERFNGGEFKDVSREVFRRGNAVGVLLVDIEKHKVVLVEQFRAGAAATGIDNPWLLELVAGIIEPNEQPADVAVRESEEEAGCHIKQLKPMFSYWVSPGGSDEQFHLFCASVDSDIVASVAGLDDEHEDIKVHVVDIDTLFNWYEQGKLNNAMTLIAIQWLKLQWPNLF